MTKENKYQEALEQIHALVADEDDLIAVMSTVAFILKKRFPHFNWVGFYRLITPNTLKVGPYQGGLGCLTIDISRGVCGQCVREKTMQLHNDISKVADHIVCDSDTEAELVFPIIAPTGLVKAVLDIDAITRNCFDETDIHFVKKIADIVGNKY